MDGKAIKLIKYLDGSEKYLLHNVITKIRYFMLAKNSNDVIEALRLLTHDTDAPYLDYVKRSQPIRRHERSNLPILRTTVI